MGYKMSNMTLDEAIEHLKAITENNYSIKSKIKKYIGTEVVKAEPMSELDKLKIERNELRERIEELEEFIGQDFSEAKEKVGHYQAALLLIQRSYMVNYLDVLQTRIDLMEKK